MLRNIDLVINIFILIILFPLITILIRKNAISKKLFNIPERKISGIWRYLKLKWGVYYGINYKKNWKV